MVKIEKKTEEISRLDEIDRRILNILAKDCRTKLTVIARDIGFSVDSIKKRIEKLEKNVIKKYTIQVNDKAMGLNIGVHVHVKLKNIEEDAYQEFVNEMLKNPRVIDIMAMLGDYDLFIVFNVKDNQEMEKIKMETRQKFGKIIDNWEESITAKMYRLEEYRF